MTEFRINLIRNQVTPPAKRRAQFRSIIIYLLIMGSLLVFLAHRGTRKLIDAARHRSDIAALETAFHQEKQEHRDILAYANELGAQVASYGRSMESIDRLMGKSVNLALVFIGLTSPLPGDAYLVSFKVDPSGRDVDFEIVDAGADRGSLLNASEIAAAWNGDLALMSVLEEVKPVISQRQRVGGQNVYVLRFTSKLTAKGG